MPRPSEVRADSADGSAASGSEGSGDTISAMELTKTNKANILRDLREGNHRRSGVALSPSEIASKLAALRRHYMAIGAPQDFEGVTTGFHTSVKNFMDSQSLMDATVVAPLSNKIDGMEDRIINGVIDVIRGRRPVVRANSTEELAFLRTSLQIMGNNRNLAKDRLDQDKLVEKMMVMDVEKKEQLAARVVKAYEDRLRKQQARQDEKDAADRLKEDARKAAQALKEKTRADKEDSKIAKQNKDLDESRKQRLAAQARRLAIAEEAYHAYHAQPADEDDEGWDGWWGEEGEEEEAEEVDEEVPVAPAPKAKASSRKSSGSGDSSASASTATTIKASSVSVIKASRRLAAEDARNMAKTKRARRS